MIISEKLGVEIDVEVRDADWRALATVIITTVRLLHPICHDCRFGIAEPTRRRSIISAPTLVTRYDLPPTSSVATVQRPGPYRCPRGLRADTDAKEHSSRDGRSRWCSCGFGNTKRPSGPTAGAEEGVSRGTAPTGRACRSASSGVPRAVRPRRGPCAGRGQSGRAVGVGRPTAVRCRRRGTRRP